MLRIGKNFCQNNHIGLTDIISCVNNADFDNQEHQELLTVGFKDDNLDKRLNAQYVFDLNFNTEQLFELIDNNMNSLKGVFFTRSTNQGIPRIWQQWLNVSEYCENLNIYTQALPTPS